MSPTKERIKANSIIVRFAGDSGDGMQLTGDQFTDTTAVMGNDFSTLPDFPAEIRAPAGSLPGVSSFQIQFSEGAIYTPGDVADVLVVMNPAALKVNLKTVKKGGIIIANENAFDKKGLEKADWAANPLEDGTLKDFHVVKVALADLTKNALKDHQLRQTEIDRCKNFFALGIMFWLYDRTPDHTVKWIESKFAKRPEIAAANVAVLKAGYNFADITELFPSQYQIHKTKLEPGTYRKITGNEALAIGLVAAANAAKKTLLYCSYPITPASSILHDLSRLKNYGVKTFQAEDEISAMGSAIGASFGGQLGVTGTSGPGICLKAEALNLAVMTELPVVVIDVQRAGPSTGMPTKTEQTDLLQVMFGRNGESPVVVLAPMTPADCFSIAYEAVRIALTHMTPVIVLSDGYLANSSEPWKLPDIASLPKIEIKHPSADGKPFLPYARDPKTLARPWAVPGTPGLEHRIGGLSKADLTGNVSYDPENHEKMIKLRAEKVARVADDIPELEVRGAASGDLLVLGWGGSFGAIYQAVTELAEGGAKVSQAHLAHMNPFPRNLGAIVGGFKKVLVPELNSGHLLLMLRGAFPNANFVGLNKIQGSPFLVSELKEGIRKAL